MLTMQDHWGVIKICIVGTQPKSMIADILLETLITDLMHLT